MWNSNSVIAWLLARSGLPMEAIRPPAGGRAPGWEAGLVMARRHQASDDRAWHTSRITLGRQLRPGELDPNPRASLDNASRASWTMSGGHVGQRAGGLRIDLDDRHDASLLLQLLGQPLQGLVELPPARRAGCRTRRSPAASASTTVLPVRMTSPETDPSIGNIVPASSSA